MVSDCCLEREGWDPILWNLCLLLYSVTLSWVSIAFSKSSATKSSSKHFFFSVSIFIPSFISLNIFLASLFILSRRHLYKYLVESLSIVCSQWFSWENSGCLCARVVQGGSSAARVEDEELCTATNCLALPPCLCSTQAKEKQSEKPHDESFVPVHGEGCGGYMERVGFGFSAHYPSFEPCSEQVKGHQEIPATCLNKPLFGEFISRNKAVLMQANQEGDRMNTLKGIMMPSG